MEADCCEGTVLIGWFLSISWTQHTSITGNMGCLMRCPSSHSAISAVFFLRSIPEATKIVSLLSLRLLPLSVCLTQTSDVQSEFLIPRILQSDRKSDNKFILWIVSSLHIFVVSSSLILIETYVSLFVTVPGVWSSE